VPESNVHVAVSRDNVTGTVSVTGWEKSHFCRRVYSAEASFGSSAAGADAASRRRKGTTARRVRKRGSVDVIGIGAG
jgi:hypothetical protein